MKLCKMLSLLLAALMMFSSLVACGEADDPAETKANTVAVSNGVAETEPETADPADEALERLTDIDWGDEDFCILFVSDIPRK